jgi:hypothetical protein
LAASWKIPLTKKSLNSLTEKLAKLHFETSEEKHKLISETRINSYQWLKTNIFENLTPEQWQEKYFK